MSEHTWILDNLPTYTAGGLDPDERGRFENHLAACPNCARALEQSQKLDQKLETLFAGIRPQPGLEDRVIQSLRKARPRRKMSAIWWIPLSAAALIMIGLLGAGF